MDPLSCTTATKNPGFFQGLCLTSPLVPVLARIQMQIHSLMPTFTDQMGNSIVIENAPQRIISLVPSQTELLYNLGLDAEVIGITKFCVHPDYWYRTKQRVGGTKTVDIEKVKALQPSLVIANKEENVKEQIEALQQIAPVWISDINDLDGALNMIVSIGDLVNKKQEAINIVEKIKAAFAQLTTNVNDLSSSQTLKTIRPLRSAYLIWRNPYMAAGGDTFINDMVMHCGFYNIFSDQLRYPEITIDQLSSINCQLLLLSSEPYPFKQKHIDELQVHLPNTTIVLVDGEMFSWYGSRLVLAATYFKDLQLKLIE
jgi:ABC-type Fe3+-hydroxamate transport system substrate-binding protein